MKENQTDERFDSSPMDEIGRNDERDLRSSKHTYRVPLAIPRKAGSGEGNPVVRPLTYSVPWTAINTPSEVMKIVAPDSYQTVEHRGSSDC